MMRRSSEVCYVMKQLVLLCCPLHATVGLGYCGILVFIFFHTILACFLEALTFRDGYEVHYVHIDLGQTSTKVERFWQVPLSCLLFSWCEWGGGQLVQERCGLHHCLAHLLTISPSLIWRQVSSWYMPGTPHNALSALGFMRSWIRFHEKTSCLNL
jgi:hypothetical protein